MIDIDEQDRMIEYYIKKNLKLENLTREDIFIILNHLVCIGNYDSAFNIIGFNNLGEEYMKLVIDLAFKYIDLSSAFLNSEKVSKSLYSQDVESLYSLYESLVYFNIKKSYEFDIKTYINKIKNALLDTGDISYIIKAGIYLDNSILDLLFKDKIKLLSFLILNDYPDDYIQKVKEIYCFTEEKDNLNKETEEILSRNINMQKEKTLYFSSKKGN